MILSAMSSVRNKRYRTRSSKIVCSEKLCCSKDNVEAVWQCDECSKPSSISYQCNDCKTYMHSRPPKASHIPKPIEQPPSEQLCSLQTCIDRNFADIWCPLCKAQYCAMCDDKYHQSNSKRKLHKRVTMKTYLTKKEAEAKHNNSKLDSDDDDEDFQSIEASLESTFSDKQTSSSQRPIPLTRNTSDQEDGDGSLKFVTMFDNDATVTDTGHRGKALSHGASEPMVVKHRPPDAGKSVSKSLPDVTTETALLEVELDSFDDKLGRQNSADEERFKDCESFVLIDSTENIQVKDPEEFIIKLNCNPDQNVKFVSIFGNTGDGKSHTFNHAFFGGKQIFSTSADQVSCTVGVWAAYNPLVETIFLDTEGLLGVSDNENQRTRLLLKVLAISDVIIYRTRAERLHNDLYRFLADASDAFLKYFKTDLESVSKKHNINIHELGPVAVIFQETTHTDVLHSRDGKTVENQLRQGFTNLGRDISAYSDLKYVGTKTARNRTTSFKELEHLVIDQLKDLSKRTPRKPAVVFDALKVLNKKFTGDIKDSGTTFPDEYFTCKSHCLSCGDRCTLSMNHDPGEHKASKHRCKFQHQYENRIFLCKKCTEDGESDCHVLPKIAASNESSWFALAKYAVSGYVLECKRCGIIYRSRQYWYGNTEPDRGNPVVKTEVRHVWPGKNTNLQGTHNAAQRFLDGIQGLSEALSSISAKPTKMMSDWVNDQIAPAYWRPNSEITKCQNCQNEFDENESKHHCRKCGDGFCDSCSSYEKPVPERGWGESPVRVCKQCYEMDESTSDSTCSENEVPQVTARKMVEGVSSTLGAVKTAVDYPIGYIKESARPSYWIPDESIKNCAVCSETFGPKLRIHHCRSCGGGVCDACSSNRMPVPSRGWEHDVRVCTKCVG